MPLRGCAGFARVSDLHRTCCNNRRMDSRPIGVFDSGTGGLTVLHECLVTMPREDFVYLGDLARLPYGPRPLEEIGGTRTRSPVTWRRRGSS